ncbi:MAG: NUDIX domain-containing protein [Odoribacteraceae bacterium]|jgi:isopentenyldiphosphate isomerase|nr:NUDIX domain-containing protein [Odoribacteraceae bacterium]
MNLAYTLPVLLLAALVAWALRARRRGREWLPVVNKKGEVIGKATRRRCHDGSRLLHPVVHLHVVAPSGEILLQKRGKRKALLPGKWDAAVGGHVSAGEPVEAALKRESLEELGITRLTARFLGSYIWETDRERELVHAFLCTGRDEIRANTGEVEEARFWSRTAIEEPANAALFTPNFLHEYALFLK